MDAVRVGLQLLLVQPSDGAVVAFRAGCLAAGAVPTWLAYKAARGGDAKAKDRALRLAVAAGALQLAEGLLLAPTGLARWRYVPMAKLALLAWMLLDDCKGADAVFWRIAAALAPHEDDIDALTSAAAPILSHAAASFLSPLRAAAGSCAAVCLAGFRLGRAHYARRQRLQALQLEGGQGGGGDAAALPRHPRQAGQQRTTHAQPAPRRPPRQLPRDDQEGWEE
ncbi:hypothetical protein Rsub_11072 [Raphidocelis subcapitata]|uniref:HVA22-like protein n=1 Tax=Raphidocelis subcapitata TaxID=307507 RepID=A0A2V0PGW9_9CHLO|nr:hypothetical protein Rsub_11072 [Raphidocelis subcapitata]|eukprot:GBF98252.1 hypothetical protein Rsub_11072 [Raphidocelis subcapitata]